MVAATQFTTNGFKEDIQQAQQGDPWSVYKSSTSPQWHKSPLALYCKLWPQLWLFDSALCQRYTPQPCGTVLILPKSLQTQVLQQCPAAGHQGSDKTLELLRKKAYWVSMIKDVEICCRQCQKFQQSKLSLPL